jgi:hypothetical protein
MTQMKITHFKNSQKDNRYCCHPEMCTVVAFWLTPEAFQHLAFV